MNSAIFEIGLCEFWKDVSNICFRANVELLKNNFASSAPAEEDEQEWKLC